MQFLDAETRRQLGFDDIWSRIRPVSSLGRSWMRKATAFTQDQSDDLVQELNRLEGISVHLKRDPSMAENLSFLLSTVRDIGGSLNRSMQGITLDDMEFYEVKKLLMIVGKIQVELERLGWTTFLPAPFDRCIECKEALGVGQGGHASFYLADAYDEQLARVRKERAHLERVLAEFRASVDSEMIQAVGRILSMNGDIAVSTKDKEMISRLEAMVELEKVQETSDCVTFQLVEDERMDQVRQTLSQIREEEERIKHQVRVKLTCLMADYGPRLRGVLEQVAFFDVLLAKAKFAAEIDGVKPQLCEDSIIRINKGRHPLVEEEVTQGGHDYTPLCLEVSSGVTLITGPNMGGKTASLKTTGLLVVMAQYGLMVPASSMEFRPRQFVRAHLAAAEIPRGLSAFAGEVVFLRDVIEGSDGDGLILVDEIAHGTNPVEGAGVAQAVLEYLNYKPTITAVTTHYPSLAQLEDIAHLRVRGLDKGKLGQGQIDSLQRYMDYSLEVVGPGRPLRSDAVIVADALGLNSMIIKRAKELLEKRDRTDA